MECLVVKQKENYLNRKNYLKRKKLLEIEKIFFRFFRKNYYSLFRLCWGWGRGVYSCNSPHCALEKPRIARGESTCLPLVAPFPFPFKQEKKYLKRNHSFFQRFWSWTNLKYECELPFHLNLGISFVLVNRNEIFWWMKKSVLDERINSLKVCLPKFFQRRPRTIKELKNYKVGTQSSYSNSISNDRSINKWNECSV